jgi:cysteine desulfuration protein SufE
MSTCFAKRLPPFPNEQKVAVHRVPGCVSQVYVTASLEQGKVIFQGDSDSQLTKGLVGLLVEGLNGLDPAEIIQLTPDFIQQTGLDISLTPSRAPAILSMEIQLVLGGISSSNPSSMKVSR